MALVLPMHSLGSSFPEMKKRFDEIYLKILKQRFLLEKNINDQRSRHLSENKNVQSHFRHHVNKDDVCIWCVFYLKNGSSRPLFGLFSSFQTNITFFTTNICEKMSIQYTVLGFEHTTFKTWVSIQNHWTRAPAQICLFI